MKILLVSTLKRRIGEDVFASRSRVIYQLGKRLVEKGHEVSLLGTGDSHIPGVTVIPVIEKGWVDEKPVENAFNRDTASLIRQAQMMIDLQDEFDVIHNHTYPDFFPHILENELKIPLVTTLHALYDTYMDELLSTFHQSHFVALSKAYQRLYIKANIEFVVYNGVDTSLYSFSEKKGDYLLWLGRLPKAKNSDGTFMDPKGVRWAIQLAKEANVPLRLYGVVEDREFYDRDVAPHLSDAIQWVGDVGPEQSLPVEKVVTLMQDAKAFLMTINQQEPFGLVMAEAMSCGTPVVGWKRGSVEEVVVEGKTGFVISPDGTQGTKGTEEAKGELNVSQAGIEGLVEAVKRIGGISPQACREHVEKNFSIEAMVGNYEKLYQALINR